MHSTFYTRIFSIRSFGYESTLVQVFCRGERRLRCCSLLSVSCDINFHDFLSFLPEWTKPCLPNFPLLGALSVLPNDVIALCLLQVGSYSYDMTKMLFKVTRLTFIQKQSIVLDYKIAIRNLRPEDQIFNAGALGNYSLAGFEMVSTLLILALPCFIW